MSTESEDSASYKSSDEQNNKKSRKLRGDISFFNLIKNLKNMFGENGDSMKSSIETIVHKCVNWVITWVFQNIQNLPFLQVLFN